MTEEGKIRWFHPLRGKQHRREILAFDIEGRGGDDGFVCGCISGEYLDNFFTDRADMFEALLYYGERGYWLFSHNLEYDLPILAGDQFWRGDMLFTSSRMLWVDYKTDGGKARFLDSLNLFPKWSVAALGKEFGLPKRELPNHILTSLQAGAKWGSFTAETQTMIERYCRRDAEIVYKALSWMQEIALELGGQLSSTIAGVSMDVYRRKYHKWPWKAVGEATNEFVRPAFYGGRVENFAHGRVEGVNMYDITSLYPSVQASANFPHPNKLKVRHPAKPGGNWWYWEGIAKATIEVPETRFPLLPFRYQGRLFFPHGILTGCWTIEEIRQAEQRGYKIRSVEWAIGSPTSFNPFEEFVEQLFDKRMAMRAGGDKREFIVKLILNSLYGRFGLNPDPGLMRALIPDGNTEHEELKGFHEYPMGDWLVAVGPVKESSYPSYVNVFMAAQVAALGRLSLLEELERQGDRALYCDTDSVITLGEVQTEEGLGEWRPQMLGGTVDLLAPKEYALHNLVAESEYHVKGVPRELAEEYLQRGHARFVRALRVREALHEGANPAEWVQTFRSRQEVIPKRCLQDRRHFERHGWALTRPWHVEELPGLVAPRKLKRKYSPYGQGIVYSGEALYQQLLALGELQGSV
jgi:hypothetical protein